MSEAERGAGTVLIIGVIAAVMLVALAVFSLSDRMYCVARAQAAADFSALAGAETLRVRGPDSACEQAEILATRNGADMDTCAIAGSHVRVGVSLHTHLGIRVPAHADAGPEDDPP